MRGDEDEWGWEMLGDCMDGDDNGVEVPLDGMQDGGVNGGVLGVVL